MRLGVQGERQGTPAHPRHPFKIQEVKACAARIFTCVSQVRQRRSAMERPPDAPVWLSPPAACGAMAISKKRVPGKGSL